MTDKVHYRYSPSSTKRWINCPGSVDAPPSKSSIYAEDGQAAHALGEQAIRTGQSVDDPAVSIYVDYVAKVREKNPIIEFIEETREHAEIEGLGGTGDYVAVYFEAELTILHFVDYKHGEGIPVSVVENDQLLTYAEIFRSFFPPGTIDVFRLTIIQPRCADVDPEQTWDASAERVAAHADAIKLAQTQSHLKAGEWCRFCSLAATCDVLREESLRIAQLQFAQAEVEELLRLHTMADAIRASLTELESVLLEKARTGLELPGYKIVESVGNRKWAAAEDVIFRRLLKLGIKRKQAVSSKLLSPAKIEKLLPKEARKGAFTGLITREQIGLRVVPETARGESVLLSADQIFSIEGNQDESANSTNSEVNG